MPGRSKRELSCSNWGRRKSLGEPSSLCLCTQKSKLLWLEVKYYSIYSNLMFHISRFKIVYAGMILYDVKSEAIIRIISTFQCHERPTKHKNSLRTFENKKVFVGSRWSPRLKLPVRPAVFCFPAGASGPWKILAKRIERSWKAEKPEGFWPKAQFFRIIWTNLSGFFDFQRGNKKTWRPPVAFWWGRKQTPCFHRPKRLSTANLNVLNGSVKFLSRPRLASSHSWRKGLPADKKAKPSKTGAPFQKFS